MFKTFIMTLVLMVLSLTHATVQAATYNDHAKAVMLERFDGVKEHLYEASVTTGINMAELTAIASLESKLRPAVRNESGHGSAKGILQYTNRTWKVKRAEYAKELGISSKANQYNLRANLLIGGKDLQDIKQFLIDQTHVTRDTLRLGDVYMAHFLGHYGAVKLINSYSHTPMNKIVKIHPGNKRYYYKPNGQIRTAREFRNYMDEIAKREVVVYEKAIMEYQVSRLFEPLKNAIVAFNFTPQFVAALTQRPIEVG